MQKKHFAIDSWSIFPLRERLLSTFLTIIQTNKL